MKHHHFLPVFAALIAGYIAMHFYAARAAARIFCLTPAQAGFLRAVLLAAALISPSALFLRRHWHGAAPEALFAAGYAWMGIILVASLVLACAQIASAIPLPAGWEGWRTALPRLTAAALLAAPLWALYQGTRTPALREITLAVPGLPAGLEGLRIAQISDVHIDSAAKLRRFGRVADLVTGAAPDLVLITGDLIDPGLTCRQELGGVMAGLKSRLGIYGVLGNHEYYYGLDKSMECYREFGIKLLRNGRAELGPLTLAGIGDIHTEGLTEKDVRDVLGRPEAGKFKLVMSHQPLYYETMAECGAGLILSGHTHRGQIFPFHLFTRMFYRYFYGLGRIKGAFFYVTSGAGTWGPPLRLLAPSEVPLFTLTRAGGSLPPQ